ncbi:helix-turn-helix domain-containing protein [Sphingomonas sp. GV3]|uniref:helix-turn-helix domain-containing protein n=1 Tax=Sphingomonas sp. GV3 TaxID=3040671 RepID=UPI0035B5BB2A
MAYVLYMHPANRLRELRKAAGLSQSELAEKSGVSQPYISQVENHSATTLDIARMRALARDLHCKPADLLSDEDNPDRLSEVERALVQAFRSSDPVQRELIMRIAQPVDVAEAGERRAA